MIFIFISTQPMQYLTWSFFSEQQVEFQFSRMKDAGQGVEAPSKTTYKTIILEFQLAILCLFYVLFVLCSERKVSTIYFVFVPPLFINQRYYFSLLSDFIMRIELSNAWQDLKKCPMWGLKGESSSGCEKRSKRTIEVETWIRFTSFNVANHFF